MARTEYAERLAAVETEIRGLRSDVAEIHGDMKSLLAAHNRQNGAARLLALLWAGLLSLGGLVGGLFMGRGHG
jgi:hypothetical protein